MTTISGLPPTSTYNYPSATTPKAVAPTPNQALPGVASSLALQGNLVGALVAGQTAGATTYNAQGLLGSFSPTGGASSSATSGNSPQASASPTSTSTSLNQAIVGSLSPTSSSSGVYTASGVLVTLPSTDVTSNWTTMLQQNPGLAASAIGNSMNQAIVGSLSAFA